MIQGNFGIISTPNRIPSWYYSLYGPPFRVRSGEVALDCPELQRYEFMFFTAARGAQPKLWSRLAASA